MAQPQSNILRKEITYFDGVNSLVSSNVAKKEEIMHSENARSPMIGTVEKREGISVVGDLTASKTYSTNNYGLFYFSNDLNTKNGALYKISKISGINSIYWLNTNTDDWTILAGLGAGIGDPTLTVSTCVAEGSLYIAEGELETRYITSNGTTVWDSGTSTGNLYRCPGANLINYYKGRLYVADYWKGVRLKNTVLMSSTQLGILALVNNDVKIGETVIPVTENKYFIPGETIQIYRGSTLMATGTVASVQETTITLNAVTTVALNAADEIWVNNTYGGAGVSKVFRWVANAGSMGVDAKDYDTFKVSSTTDNDNETINVMTNVGNYMILMTNNNVAVWNSYVLQNLDLGVGCVSRQGYVKTGGSLYFVHYTGVYETAGAMPKYLSSKVERYFAGATRAGLEASSAGKKGRSVFFAIGDVTLRNPDGSAEKTLHDVCLEYNITQENWYVHTNWKVKKMVTYYASASGVATDPDVLVGMSEYTTTNGVNPIVEFLDVGNYLDITSEIPFRIDTPNIMLGNTFQMVSYPQEVHLEMERGRGMKCFVSLDLGDWYELDGEAGKGATIFKINSKDKDIAQPPRCRNIRLSFRHNEKQLCKISKVAILYMLTPEEEPFKEDDPGYISSTQ